MCHHSLLRQSGLRSSGSSAGFQNNLPVTAMQPGSPLSCHDAIILSDGYFTTLARRVKSISDHIICLRSRHTFSRVACSLRSSQSLIRQQDQIVEVLLTCSEMICCRPTASAIHVSSTLEAPWSLWPAALLISWSTCLLASGGTAGCEAELVSCRTRKVAATAAAVPAVTPQLPCAACSHQPLLASLPLTGLLDIVAGIKLHEKRLCIWLSTQSECCIQHAGVVLYLLSRVTYGHPQERIQPACSQCVVWTKLDPV